MQGSSNYGLKNSLDTIRYPYSYPSLTPDTANGAPWTFPMDFGRKQSHIEVLDVLFNFDNFGVNEGDRTFKSSANHDFGIVYYDERGRHGFVNHLTTVYVPGYSQQERGGTNHGRSIIKLSLDEKELLIVNKIKMSSKEPDFSGLDEITHQTTEF